MRRAFLGLSQTDLAGRMDVSYQQVQKYESGHNAVSASRLYQLAQSLDVPITYFFQGLSDEGVKTASSESVEYDKISRSLIKLIQAFSEIPTPRDQAALVRLTQSIAQSSVKSNSTPNEGAGG